MIIIDKLFNEQEYKLITKVNAKTIRVDIVRRDSIESVMYSITLSKDNIANDIVKLKKNEVLNIRSKDIKNDGDINLIISTRIIIDNVITELSDTFNILTSQAHEILYLKSKINISLSKGS